MEYRKLGRTGLEVSSLTLGTMQFGWTTDEQSAFAVLDAFLAAGGNLLDTADVYSRWAEGNPGGVAEEIIGRWTRARAARGRVLIATKVRGRMWGGPNGEGLSRAHIVRAAEDSLRRLQTDVIDLYQTHSPDRGTPIDETLRAFDDLVRAGKVRYIGCSNYPAWRLMQALWASDRAGLERFVSVQPHYNLAHRAEFERELADVAAEYGLGVLPYSPLQGGLLTGKYRRGAPLPDTQRATSIARRWLTDRNLDLIDRMDEIGRAHGSGVLQVALAWLLARPAVTSPIIGANTVEQLQASLDALDLRLAGDEIRTLDALTDWREEWERRG